MNGNQKELFLEMPSGANPNADFARFRVGKKIIQIPVSFWKDGRANYDLTAHGGGIVRSRDLSKADQMVIDYLRDAFGTIVEAIRDRFTRAGRPAVAMPRSNNKRPVFAQRSSSVRYINPFSETAWKFAKCPDWLFVRREPTPTEKRVYAKLLYPAPPICERYDRNEGIIFGLNQGELANALGVRRKTANYAIKSLKMRGLIEATGRPGARQVIRFLWHEWMPQTCPLKGQAPGSKAVPATPETWADNGLRPVPATPETWADKGHVSQGVEKRESAREERHQSLSSPW